jgi:hypothetical protein
MTAGQTTGRLSNVSLAPALLAGLLAATLLSGALIGAALTLQIRSTDSTASTIGTAAQPAATFDAVQFRAEERAAPQAPAKFDAVKFREEERSVPVLAPAPGGHDRPIVSNEHGK